jgi:hypothetical protein
MEVLNVLTQASPCTRVASSTPSSPAGADSYRRAAHPETGVGGTSGAWPTKNEEENDAKHDDGPTDDAAKKRPEQV